MPDDSPGRADPPRDEPPASVPLARRPDFPLGNAKVRPSLRTIEGPDGRATVEPRVMQVLLAFADAGGAVLTREDLNRICWNGQIVGDDSINRAIAELRRVGRQTGASFQVETIPRIGYRVTGAAGEATATAAADADPIARPPLMSRRLLVGGGVALAAAGGLGLWALRPARADPRAARLIERGKRALRDSLPDRDKQGVQFFEQALAIEPENSEAWGLLALGLREVAEIAPPDQTSAAVRACESAARRALAIDPRNGNALTALAVLRPYLGDWQAGERRLREVLAIAPDNEAAITQLVLLLQSVGRARLSFSLNRHALAIDPLSPVHLFREGLKLWILGRTGEADLSIDRSLQLWPRHPAVWNARLMIFAYTGRARAAMAMIDDPASRPATLPAHARDIWRATLIALESRAPADVAAARRINMEAAPSSPGFSVNAIMALSALGEIDAAFTVADGYLLRRGPLVGRLFTGGGQMPVNDQRWRRTMMLFTPAVAAFRADPRFNLLCDGIGLTEYWRRVGVGPDFPLPPRIA